VRWRDYAAAGVAPHSSFLSALTAGPSESRGTQDNEPTLLAVLATSPAASRQQVIVQHVRRAVQRVLGLEPSFVLELNHGLRHLGLDSLMAVELRNRLQAETGQPLRSTLAFDYPTLAALAAYIEQLVASPGPADAPAARAVVQESAAAELAALSEDEAEAVLLRELQG
jgi:acyl carrier protein